MLHHVSIAAKETKLVAQTIAELTNGKVGELGPWPDGYIVWASDEAGTAIEIYPHGTELAPDDADGEVRFCHNYFAPDRSPTHAAISVSKTIEEVVQIARRVGWRCVQLDRGGFNVLELWIENNVLFEVMTQDMLAAYLGVVHAPRVAEAGIGAQPLSMSIRVSASPEELWRSWTNSEAIRTWWPMPEAKIDLRIGGAFELLFLPDGAEGQRGTEGCRILSYVPESMLSFTWPSPSHIPGDLAHTWVVLSMRPDSGGTEVELTQLGFGVGPEWDACRQYFRHAWMRMLRKMSAHWAPDSSTGIDSDGGAVTLGQSPRTSGM
ncbi:MAG: SRPBCC domain-containing protein [Candidatus Nanopelagicales bacterium]|nr:SRPBCC domain-containing protein [Candidatus Nanopelagicales bacterium]MDZ4249407.1 SRPBCC domain-containing protein [Candidatus Nanopelagicales bacterium]